MRYRGSSPGARRGFAALLAAAMLVGVGSTGPALAAGTAPISHGRVPAAGSDARFLGEPASPVQEYPRLANLYAYQDSEQAEAFSRYGLVVSQYWALANGALAALKKASPSTIALEYYESAMLPVPGWPGQGIYYTDIYPGWWLTLAGTTLAAPLDATSTQVSVTDGSVISKNLTNDPDVLVDGESMHVTAVNGNTLTVERGYYSTAAAHAAGARIAAHAVDWPGNWMLNASSYCPVDPATGQTWDQYLATTATRSIAGTQWDGIYLDGGGDFAWVANGQIDANSDNVPDGGDGPSGTGWVDGMASLFSLVRSLAPNTTIVGNGAVFPQSNGEEIESYENYWWDFFDEYLSLAGPNGTAPLSIVNPDTGATGAQDLQTMRFGLGMALMANGYFAYDGGGPNHGQTWWYDEYDNGAGSSLPSAINATQTRFAVAPGTGRKFSVGDVVHVPDDGTEQRVDVRTLLDFDDEQMLVAAVHGDTLTVRRAYNGTSAEAHLEYSKVMTEAQIEAGQGWLGQPLDDASMIGTPGPNMLMNGSFDETGSNWLGPWTAQGQSPAVFTVTQDTSTAESGQASAKVTISTASPGDSWKANLAQNGLSLTAGTTYTLAFWAKGTPGTWLTPDVIQTSPWQSLAVSVFNLASNWQLYTVTVTPSENTSSAEVRFDFAQSPGTIWLDNVSLGTGDPNVWRRDFTHGTVLLNATASPQTVNLGPGYNRIAGTQDPNVNSGAPASSVTLPAHDAIILAVGVQAAGELSVSATHRSITIAGSNFPSNGRKVALYAYGMRGARKTLIGTASVSSSSFKVTSIAQKKGPCGAGGFKHLEVDAYTTTSAGQWFEAAKARATVACPGRAGTRAVRQARGHGRPVGWLSCPQPGDATMPGRPTKALTSARCF